jgi:hypothetical protein
MTGSVDFQTDDPSAGINITRDDPGLVLDTIAACLDVQYGLRVSSVTFLPLGYDLNAAVYKVITEGGTNHFFSSSGSGASRSPGCWSPGHCQSAGSKTCLLR